jgi:hypothetical protein
MGGGEVTERRALTLREIVMVLTLLLNVGGLIWGAAKITSTVDDLTKTTSRLDNTVSSMATIVTNMQVEYNARIRVLEDRTSRKE